MFFFNDTATTEIYTLSRHDALPILGRRQRLQESTLRRHVPDEQAMAEPGQISYRVTLERGIDGSFQAWVDDLPGCAVRGRSDRKSTRLNSSHANISYAVFCLKKKSL